MNPAPRPRARPGPPAGNHWLRDRSSPMLTDPQRVAGLVPIQVRDAADPRLADYVRLTDASLRKSLEADRGLFVAEGEKVIRRGIEAGYPVRSLLVTEDKLAGMAGLADGCAAPVYVLPAAIARQLTGYQVHRGALASMARRALPPVTEILAGTKRLFVLEDLVDHGNVGAIFRCAAAFGAGGVVLSPRCADPLYRRAGAVAGGGLPAARAHPGSVGGAAGRCAPGGEGGAAARLGGGRPVVPLAARARPGRVHPDEPGRDGARGGLAERGRRRGRGLPRPDAGGSRCRHPAGVRRGIRSPARSRCCPAAPVPVWSRPMSAAPAMGGISTTRTAAAGAAAASRSVIHPVSSGSRAVSRPPPSTTGVARPASPRRGLAVSVIARTSAACPLTRSRDPLSPASAAAKSAGVSSCRLSAAMVPWWMPIVTSATPATPKWPISASRNEVCGQRPSSARIAHHSPARPSPSPPPQSPLIPPRARKRTVRPSGATPTQLMPAPQVTATPQGLAGSVSPALSTANVSLATCVVALQPCAPSISPSSSSSSGRSALAMHATVCPATAGPPAPNGSA